MYISLIWHPFLLWISFKISKAQPLIASVQYGRTFISTQISIFDRWLSVIVTVYEHLSPSTEVKSVSFTAGLWLNWLTDCLFLYWRLTVCSVNSQTKNMHAHIYTLFSLLFLCKCLFHSFCFFISKSLFLLFLVYSKTRTAVGVTCVRSCSAIVFFSEITINFLSYCKYTLTFVCHCDLSRSQ